MLRHTDDATIAEGNPIEFASFPLVPFSNRIGHARFEWDGQNIAITPNFAPEPHAIHGVGWRRAWHITERGNQNCIMALDHMADADWPWNFHAEQSFYVRPYGLDIALSITNTDSIPTPIAFGHHPYFDAAGATLTFAAQRVYMSDADDLPTDAIAPVGDFDFRTDGRVEGRNIDHCYADWDGIAHIAWDDRPLALHIVSDMPATVVYIPKKGEAFCFEPVPHINNSLQRQGEQPEIPCVAPGATYRSSIQMRAIGNSNCVSSRPGYDSSASDSRRMNV